VLTQRGGRAVEPAARRATEAQGERGEPVDPGHWMALLLIEVGARVDLEGVAQATSDHRRRTQGSTLQCDP
jgi:hypothetical protein